MCFYQIFWGENYEGGDADKAGYLYIGIGDGGAAGDPVNNALNPYATNHVILL